MNKLWMLALLIPFAGCSLELPKGLVDPNQDQQQQQGAQDPAIESMQIVFDAIAAAQEFGVHPAPPPPTGGTLPPPPAPAETGIALAPTGPTPPVSPLFCDTKPTVAFQTICGNTRVVQTAHVAWSGCTPPPPPGQTTSDMSISGVLDTAMELTATCGAVTDVTYTRNTTFSVTRKTSKGENTTKGNVKASGTQALITDTFTRAYALDITGTGTAQAPAGATAPTQPAGPIERRLQGSLTVDFKGGKDVKPVSTYNGTLQSGPGSVEFQTLVAGGDCRWPSSGTIVRTDDKGTHSMTFGPECGKATLDGKAVNLDPTQDPQQQPPQ